MSIFRSSKDSNSNRQSAAAPDLRKGVHGSVASKSPIIAELDPLLSEDAGPVIVAPGSRTPPGQTSHE